MDKSGIPDKKKSKTLIMKPIWSQNMKRKRDNSLSPSANEESIPLT